MSVWTSRGAVTAAYLNIVSDCLGANDDPVPQDTNLTPARADALRRETAKVLQFAVLEDLDEGGARELAHDRDLSTIPCSPSP